MATNMEGSQLASGGVLTGSIDELIVGGGFDGSTSDHYHVTDGQWQTTGGEVNVNTTFEFEGSFELTEVQAEMIKEIIGHPVGVVKKRIIPKHRMIRED